MTSILASLQPIVEAIGIAGCEKVVCSFGGSNIWIPKAENLKEGHPLVTLLGREDATRFCQLLGGCYLDVPRAAATKLAARDKEISDAIQRKTPVGSIARTYGLTERRVRMIAATFRAKADEAA